MTSGMMLSVRRLKTNAASHLQATCSISGSPTPFKTPLTATGPRCSTSRTTCLPQIGCSRCCCRDTEATCSTKGLRPDPRAPGVPPGRKTAAHRNSVASRVHGSRRVPAGAPRHGAEEHRHRALRTGPAFAPGGAAGELDPYSSHRPSLQDGEAASGMELPPLHQARLYRPTVGKARVIFVSKRNSLLSPVPLKRNTRHGAALDRPGTTVFGIGPCTCRLRPLRLPASDIRHTAWVCILRPCSRRP